MHPAISELCDNQPRKKRRVDDGDGETLSSWYNPSPQPYHLPPLSNHAAFDQSVKCGEYSTTTHGEGSSTWSCPSIALFSEGGGEKGLAVEEDLALSQCCFGMLSRIPVKIKRPLNSSSQKLPVVFQKPNALISTTEPNQTLFEIASNEAFAILAELESATEIATQLYCQSEHYPQLLARSKGKQKGNAPRSWVLNIIIYGPMALEGTVGDFLSKRRMYLQDPLGCDRNVLYRNPHILSPEMEDVIMTSSFDSVLENPEIERLEAGPDLLAQLMADEDPLHETHAPAGVKTTLFGYQKQALTFLLRRERGWAMDQGDRDIWTKYRDMYGRINYLNNVSGAYQVEPPPNFQGGLLADDMGLGKTLSMICLIVANQACQSLPLLTITPQPEYYFCSPVKATLLIVPPSLIKTWKEQFELHLQPGLLKCYIYHGQNRKHVKSLAKYDVVITTYFTVSAIWRQNQRSLTESHDSIFSITWHRVVLDEAHIIQNWRSNLAQSCYALHAHRKWAITGTPIQNRLTDFLSIVKFLKVYPYSEDGVFEDDISKPWQKGDPQGFLRLKTLVRNITIRRTKAVVCLPHRMDEIHHLDFSMEERQVYELAKVQTVALLEEAISSGNQRNTTCNALERLNVLRLICSHGLLTQTRQSKTEARSPEDTITTGAETVVEQPFTSSSWMVANNCSICSIWLLDESLTNSEITDVRNLSSHMLCEGCYAHISTLGPNQMFCNQYLHSQNVITPMTLIPDADIPIAVDQETANIDLMSTKVKALIIDLRKHCHNEKSVVFSFWTYTLDLVELMLKMYGILYVRIDGKIPLSKRTSAIESFQKDESLRVILVSISCGGAGLDLTAASRAYLLEPHWNPMIEEQALCRVYRIGQQRNVTTIRYVMRDSFEEQVVQIQKRKKLLAKVTFCQGPLSEAGIGLGTLQELKTVLE